MNTLSLAGTVATAFVVTFATAVIPNPSTVAASRYAVRRGPRAAAVFLAAVLCLDVAVFLGLMFGFHPFLHHLGALQHLTALAGAALLIVGVVMVVAAHRSDTRLLSTAAGPEGENGGSRRGPFLAGLLVPAANPGFWAWWTTVGTSFIHAARRWGGLGLGLLMIALLGGVVAWYIPLLWALGRGCQVLSARSQQRLQVCLGLIMIAFGMVLAWRTVGELGLSGMPI